MRTLVIFIPAYLLFSFVISFGAEGFGLLGVQFPFSETEKWLLDSDTVFYSRFPAKFDIQFYLSPAGSVDSFTYSPSEKSVYVKKISRSLNSIKFYPAKVNDTVIPFILPAELVFEAEFGSPHVELRFPYDEPECYKVKPLIEKTLELNEVTPPRINRFPSYFCFFRGKQNLEDFPYAIFKVDLDSTGSLLDYEELFTTRHDISKSISNAILYADFLPATYNGKAFPATFFVIVRFFDVVNYPTSDWPPTGSAGIHLPFDYLRIGTELFLDSLINPPIPVNIPGGKFRNAGVIPYVDSFEVLIEIDTLGVILSADYPRHISKRLYEVTERILKDLRFTPARDISGDRRHFEGRLRLTFNNSRIIRIVATWHPLEAQEPLE